MKRWTKCALAVLALALLAAAFAQEARTADSAVTAMCLLDKTDSFGYLCVRERADGAVEVNVCVVQDFQTTLTWNAVSSADRIEETPEGRFVPYDGCVCRILGGETEEILYEDGTGRVLFADGCAVWEDDQEHAGEGLCFVDDGSRQQDFSYRAEDGQALTVSSLCGENVTSWTFEFTRAVSETEKQIWRLTVPAEGAFDPKTLTGDALLNYVDCVCTRVTGGDGRETSEKLYDGGCGCVAVQTGTDGVRFRWLPEDDENAAEAEFFPVYLD